jgi:endonuclease YncB( thermonuclease family)
MIRLALVLPLLPVPALADPLPICSGGNRAERKLTCIVDGDTGWENGVKWRALNVDTPEISQPECAEERRLGLEARDRLRELMADGYTIEWTRDRGRYGRELAHVSGKQRYDLIQC